MTYEQLLRRMALDKERTDPLNIPEIEDIVTEPEDSVDVLDAFKAFFQVSFDVEKEIENG